MPHRPRARRTAGVYLLLLAACGLLVSGGLPGQSLRAVSAAPAAANFPAPPAGWPSTLQLGMADGPGGAAGLKATAPFGFRYQYLAGGVNTGSGWAAWNPNGDFVTYYIQDSVAIGITPVFIYYQLLQSNGPCATCDEKQKDLAHLNDTATMTALYNDLKLFFQRAGASGATRVVLNVEPDLWGFIHQPATGDDATTVPARVGATGLPELAGLPDNAAGFARAVRKLRDTYAPNVLFGYHLSIWGTGTDIQLSKPAFAHIDAVATRSANFFRSLGSDFDLAFAEFSDRDAAFYQYQFNDGGARWMTAEDFARHGRYLSTFSSTLGKRVVLWQIPLGNTKMRAMNNTWSHYQDNRVEWLLDDSTRAHLTDYLQAGVVALLFGRGADGATCACDAAGDGITNPAPINGNTGTSLNADDDGGFFRQKAAGYYTTGALALPPSSSIATPTAAPAGPIATMSAGGSPTTTPATTAQPGFASSAAVTPTSVAPGGIAAITVSVTSGTPMTGLVDVEVYSSAGAKAFQQFFDNEAFTTELTKTYAVSWPVPTTAAPGTYIVKVGIFSPGWGTLYSWNDSATQFAVTTAAQATATATIAATKTATPMATATQTSTPTPTSAAASSATSTPTRTPTASTPAPTASPTACRHRGSKCR
jgi:hypothetical protein